MLLVEFALVALALFGHVGLWIFLLNRVHSFAVPSWMLRASEALALVLLAAGGLAILAWARPLADRQAGSLSLIDLYAATCVCIAIVPMPWRLLRQARQLPPAALASDRATRFDTRRSRPAVGYRRLGRLFGALPGNESLTLAVHEKSLVVPRLGDTLDGLTIAHLSDLHFTGSITRDFFDEVVDRTLAMDADLIAITGDLVERAACLDWLPSTLGRLSAPLGVHFVLGNHDLRIDHAELRRRLASLGLIDAAREPRTIVTRGAEIDLAGNEWPWFDSNCRVWAETPRRQGVPRLLLSHSPDQFDWARRCDVDLVLAGHTHGGQVRLPWIGAIVAPSRHGVRYASGTFFEPPTVMHVSRGLSAEKPLRWNCAPELTKLTLRSPETVVDDAARQVEIGAMETERANLVAR